MYILVKTIPTYDVGNNPIFDICRTKTRCKEVGTKWEESALAWNYPGSGQTCLYMALEAVLYFLIVLLLEVGHYYVLA